MISAAECGEGRISTYACPESCEHNPWSRDHYDAALEIEDRLIPKVIERLANESGSLHPPSSIDASDHNSWWASRVFFETDASGQTFIDRWAAQGWPGLRNDERVFIQAQASLRPTVLELRESGDGWVSALDLLAPGQPAIRLVDRSLAAVAARFQTLLALVFECPHYHRIHGTAFSLPHVPGFTPDQIIESIARHQGGRIHRDRHEAWLRNNFIPTRKAASCVEPERRVASLEKSDLRRVAAEYVLRISGDDATRRLLRAGARLERGNGETLDGQMQFDWFAPHPKPTAPGAMDLPGFSQGRTIGDSVLGSLTVTPDTLQFVAHSSDAASLMRSTIERALGPDAGLSSQREEDIAKQMAATAPPSSGSVPPELLKGTGPVVKNLHRTKTAQYAEFPEAELLSRTLFTSWPDTAVPMLANRTPREALDIPELRPLVIESVKSIVRQCDEGARDRGESNAISWLLHDLGLPELDLPAPTYPLPPQHPGNDQDFEDGGDPFRLDTDEIENMAAIFDERFPTPAAAIAWLRTSLPNVTQLVDTLELQEFAELTDAVHYGAALASFIMEIDPGDEPDPEVAGQTILQLMDFIEDSDDVVKLLADLVKMSPQPNLVAFVLPRMGERCAIPPANAITLLVFLSGIVAALDDSII